VSSQQDQPYGTTPWLTFRKACCLHHQESRRGRPSPKRRHQIISHHGVEFQNALLHQQRCEDLKSQNPKEDSTFLYCIITLQSNLIKQYKQPGEFYTKGINYFKHTKVGPSTSSGKERRGIMNEGTWTETVEWVLVPLQPAALYQNVGEITK
jgi:hypothetical protein